MYLYTLNRPSFQDKIAGFECFCLTGIKSCNNFVLSEKYIDIDYAAYINECVRILFIEKDITALYEKIRNMGFTDDNFKITFINTGMHFDFQNRKKYEKVISDIFSGVPDLKNPNIEFIITYADKMWIFGEKIKRTQNRWLIYDKKPYTFCNSLPARMARAIVNIATAGDINLKLVDPCCGMGSCILEAMDMKIDIQGFDINETIVEDANKNLLHFGFEPIIKVGDASKIKGSYDAAILDLPYGLLSKIGSDKYLEIIGNIRKACSRAVILSAADITDIIKDSKFKIINGCIVHKGGLDRHIVLCEND